MIRINSADFDKVAQASDEYFERLQNTLESEFLEECEETVEEE